MPLDDDEENCTLCKLELKKKNRGKGRLWNETAKHSGPNIIPPYEKLPDDVKFIYNGTAMVLSTGAEEVMRFYAELLGDKRINTVFKRNFFNDWKKEMTPEELLKITDLEKCDFTGVQEYSKQKTKEIRAELKNAPDSECIIDGIPHKIRKPNLEFPGLFLGVQGNKDNGKFKKRIEAEDVIVNGTDIVGRWGRHENKPRVSWLWKWKDPLRNVWKQTGLHDNSTLKGNMEEAKYERVRHLHRHINTIRKSYKADWTSPNLKIQERGVALYIIDQSALRIGNEKYEDSAGCCSLHVNDIKLRQEAESYYVALKFLEKGGKHYTNELKIKQKAYELLKTFTHGKGGDEYVFKSFSAADLNKHVGTLMTGLTVKVFRTYNACLTFQKKLDEINNMQGNNEASKIAYYQAAAREVAELCNHRRNVESPEPEFNAVTSKSNYLDPRITVAWCKENKIPIKKIYSKGLRMKFKWAIDRTDSSYRFDKMKVEN